MNVALRPLHARLAKAIRKVSRGRDLELDTEITGLIAALGPAAAPLLPRLLAVWDDLDAPGIDGALEETGREGAEVLMRCLRSRKPKVRAAAAAALGVFWRWSAAVSAPARAISDPDARVRKAAVAALRA